MDLTKLSEIESEIELQVELESDKTGDDSMIGKIPQSMATTSAIIDAYTAV